ncbi:CoA-binding protein [Tistrella mobilis]|uniref:CoA-binding protein n=1 Tax=Tistrella mobilis (strain KA081020-065) TaxID=1110502 RepID=I3TQR3_TISMK|nr:CoA-binding protein [Tistrella mobilis]AFK55101.1 CoA-binding protein [Tistrella mobilis KA081020-065]
MTTAASAARGDPWTREALLPLYAPRSIAIVGASMRPGSFGARTLGNLDAYDGRIHLVNARYDTIDGRPCHASVGVLPEVPDLVVITTPAPTVEEVLEDCIAAGVPAAIVYASGFAETGDPEDAARQDRLATRAAEAGLRLLGPNCVGMLDYVSGARVTFAGVPAGRVTEGPAIGLICQSGALGFALAQAMDRGVAFSHVLSCGNSADVDVADWISALADDPHCSVIACAFEGAPDPRRFLAAAERAWARDKPLVVFKLATGEEGAVAAMSHTGSLAGSHAAWTALFDRAGAIVVEDFDALVETAAFFAKAPARTPPASPCSQARAVPRSWPPTAPRRKVSPCPSRPRRCGHGYAPGCRLSSSPAIRSMPRHRSSTTCRRCSTAPTRCSVIRPSARWFSATPTPMTPPLPVSRI